MSARRESKNGGRVDLKSAGFSTRDPRELREHPAHETHVPRDPARFEALKRSIAGEGRVRVPLVILPDGIVLCGRDRLKAAIELGIREVPVEVRADLVDDADKQLILIIDDNLARKHFTKAQRVRLASVKLDAERRLARARQAEGRRRGGRLAKGKRDATTLAGKFTGKRGGGDTRTRIAKAIGLSGRQFEKAHQVLQAGAAGNAPVATLLEEDVISISLAHDAVTVLSMREQEQIVARVRETPSPERARFARKAIREAIARASDAASTGPAVGTPRPKAPTDLLARVVRGLKEVVGTGAECERHDAQFAQALAALSPRERASLRALAARGVRTLEQFAAMLDLFDADRRGE